MAHFATTRKRVEIPLDLYEDIARDARYLHMPVQTLIVSMLATKLKADRALAGTPIRDRKPAAAAERPSRKGYSAAYAAGLAVIQDIEEQAAAPQEGRKVK